MPEIDDKPRQSGIYKNTPVPGISGANELRLPLAAGCCQNTFVNSLRRTVARLFTVIEQNTRENNAVPTRAPMTLHRTWSIAAACGLFLLAMSGGAHAAETVQTRYLRAVYVLRTLDPSLAAGTLAVPRRIITDDTTNTLVQHPDKIFVLDSMARELESLSRNKGMGDADFYAAQAYGKLGQRSNAARAMGRYLLISPYQAENYLLLVRWLYENSDYAAMRAAAADWRTRDPACNEKRLVYVWGSYLAQGQPQDALNALNNSACNGWRPQVMAARSTLDLGSAGAAEHMVDAAARRFPKNAKTIRAFWEQIREVERYP